MEGRMYELIEILQSNDPKHSYDFIANHAHEFTKEELRRIILELIYASMDWCNKHDFNAMMNDVAEELISEFSDEED